MKKSILSIVAFCFLFMSAQAQWGWGSGKKIKGNKKVVEKSIEVSDYDAIKVAGSHDVKLVQGEEGNITIRGEENIIPHIMIEVSEGTLKVYTEKGYSIYSKKPITITVPVREINSAVVSGSGSIVGDFPLQSSKFHASVSGSGDINLKIDADELQTKVTGSGDLVIQGFAKNLQATVSGSGDIDANNLKSENAYVSVVGSGDARVFVTQTIDANVTGSGDIEYRGNPQDVKTKTTGSGDIEGR